MAFLLALLTLITSCFGGLGTVGVQAASPSAATYFFRASVKQHGAISEYNSSHTGQVFYAVIDGHIGYCMNYGFHSKNGKMFVSSGETSNTVLSARQEKLLSYALFYGYASDDVNAPSNDMKDMYIATQAIVWNIEKDIFGTAAADSAARKLCDCAPNPTHAYEYYAAVAGQVQAGYDQTIPSFSSKRLSSASTYEMHWNDASKRFEVTLTDYNGVLGDFNLSVSGVSASKNGNQVTLYSNGVISDAATGVLSSNKGVYETTSSCVFWFCGDASYQEFVSERPTADPLYAYFRVKTESIGYGFLQKVDDETGSSLAGATYGIYSDSGCNNLVQSMTTGEDGTCKSEALAASTYYVKELTAPRGYVLDPSVYTLVVTAGQTTSFTRADKAQIGAISIYKEGEVLTGWNGENFVYEARKLPGATFSVTAAEDIYRADGVKAYSAGSVIAKDLTTGSDGVVVLGNLYLGAYTVTETKGIDGYVTNENPVTVNIDYLDQTAEVQYGDATIRNERQKARVTIVKKDAATHNPLVGGEFTIYAVNDIFGHDGNLVLHAGDPIQAVVTGQDGTATFTADLPYGNAFFASETKAPEGYSRSMEGPFRFSFETDDRKSEVLEYHHSFLNERVTGRINLQKVDGENGVAMPQGDASLEGAVYGLFAREDIVHPDGATGLVYAKDSLVAYLRTDHEGKAMTDGLFLGKYFVKELEPPAGYVLNETEQDIDLSFEGDFTMEVLREVTCTEQVCRQPFQLIKISSDGTGTEGNLLEGAQFMAYLKSGLQKKADGSYDFDNAIPVKIGRNGESVLTTDSKGYALSAPLPYGTYVVRESFAPHNMQPVNPFEVTIRENKPEEPQVWRVFIDREFQAKLRIVKIDAATKKAVLVPGAEFKIYDLDENKYVEMITTYPSKTVHSSFQTDEDGDLILPEALGCGHYRIEEVKAPEGYVRSDAFVEVTIDSDAFHETDSDTQDAIITVTFENVPVRGRLVIKKTGEELVDYAGKLFGGKEERQFVYQESVLSGATFAVYADEDVFTADHQKDENGERIRIYAKNDLVATMTTGKDGSVAINDLPLGRYRIEEVNAPHGFVLGTQKLNATIGYADDRTGLVEVTREFADEREKVELSIEKRDAEDHRMISGAVFGLYAEEAILGKGGKVIVNAGELLETGVSDANGMVRFTKDYPFGKYYAKELKTPDGYATNDAVIRFDAKYVAQDVPIAEYEALCLNAPTVFEFTKQDITSGAELSGATLSVIDEDGKEIDTWTSKAGEKHVIKRLMVGQSYVLREEYAPYGYLKAREITFKVLDSDSVQSVVMKDEVPTGTIVINKDGEFLNDVKAGEDGWMDFIMKWFRKPMSGVTFEVYAKEAVMSPDGLEKIYYEKDQFVATMITNDKGVAMMEGLPLGEYYVVETKTLPGFVLDPTPVYADLRYVDQSTPVVYAGDNLLNERQKVEITVVKKDAETLEPLEGAIFGLFAREDIVKADGEVCVPAGEMIERAVTGEDGRIVFVSDLPIGKYFVKETQAPLGFASTDDMFEIDATGHEGNEKVIELVAEFVNWPTKADFTKTDVTGSQELEGATLAVIDSDGKTVEAWTSGKTPHRIERLPVGKYLLREEASPYGYKVASDVEFEILDTGEIQKVSMKDETVPGRIVIRKTDAETGVGLDGVTFELRDKNGYVLSTAVTENGGWLQFGNLPICTYDNGAYREDKVYVLVETKTREGYILDSTPHEVTLRYSGKAPDVVEVTVCLTNEPTEPELPQTGGGFDGWAIAILGLFFMALGIHCLIMRRKTTKELNAGK